MTRVLLLSLAAAGLIYAAYASLAESEPEVTTSPANGSEAETLETPWTKIDPAADQIIDHDVLPVRECLRGNALDAPPHVRAAVEARHDDRHFDG
jgi:hypothetical protein